MVDGPYGRSAGFDGANTLVLIAGGTGCTYIFPLLENALREFGASALRRIIFIWSVKDSEALGWIDGSLKDELLTISDSGNMRFQIYVTGGNQSVTHSTRASSPDKESYDEKRVDGASRSFTCLETMEGRPDIQSLLKEEISTSAGSVSVFASGPNGMLSDVRGALAGGPAGFSAAMKGGPSVTLHVAEYGYA